MFNNSQEDSEKQEEAICRFCQCEGNEDNQLVHPCKCKGSVKWVHRECLREWLRQSRKMRCELCGYSYVFQREYEGEGPDGVPPRLPFGDFLRDLLSFVQSAFSKATRVVLYYALVWVFKIYFSVWVNHTFLDGSFALYWTTHGKNMPNDVVEAAISYTLIGVLLNMPSLLFLLAIPRQYERYVPLLSELRLAVRDLTPQSPPRQIIRFTVYSTLFKGLTSGVFIGAPYTIGGTVLDLLNLVSFGAVPSKEKALTDTVIGGGIGVRIVVMLIGYLVILGVVGLSFVMTVGRNKGGGADDRPREVGDQLSTVVMRNLAKVLRHAYLIFAMLFVVPVLNGVVASVANPLFCNPFEDSRHPVTFSNVVVEIISFHSSGVGYLVGTAVYLFAYAPNAGAWFGQVLGRAWTRWSVAAFFVTVTGLVSVVFTLSVAVSCTVTFKVLDPKFLPLRGCALVTKGNHFKMNDAISTYMSSFALMTLYVPLHAFFKVTILPLSRALLQRGQEQEGARLRSLLCGMALAFMNFALLTVVSGPLVFVSAKIYRAASASAAGEPHKQNENLGTRDYLSILGLFLLCVIKACEYIAQVFARNLNVAERIKVILWEGLGWCRRVVIVFLTSMFVPTFAGLCIYMMFAFAFMPTRRQHALMNSNFIMSVGLLYLSAVYFIERFVGAQRQGDGGGNNDNNENFASVLDRVNRLLCRHLVFWVRVALLTVAVPVVVLSNVRLNEDTLLYLYEGRYLWITCGVLLELATERIVSWIKSKYALARDRRYARVVVRDYTDEQ